MMNETAVAATDDIVLLLLLLLLLLMMMMMMMMMIVTLLLLLLLLLLMMMMMMIEKMLLPLTTKPAITTMTPKKKMIKISRLLFDRLSYFRTGRSEAFNTRHQWLTFTWTQTCSPLLPGILRSTTQSIMVCLSIYCLCVVL
jgi:hypothetical protein